MVVLMNFTFSRNFEGTTPAIFPHRHRQKVLPSSSISLRLTAPPVKARSDDVKSTRHTLSGSGAPMFTSLCFPRRLEATAAALQNPLLVGLRAWLRRRGSSTWRAAAAGSSVWSGSTTSDSGCPATAACVGTAATMVPTPRGSLHF